VTPTNSQELSQTIQSITGEQPPRFHSSSVIPLVATFPGGKASRDICNSDISNSQNVILASVNGNFLDVLLTTFQRQRSDILKGSTLDLSYLASRDLFSEGLNYAPNFFTLLFAGAVMARDANARIACVDLRGNKFKSLDPCRSLATWFPQLQSILHSQDAIEPPGDIAYLFQGGGFPESEVLVGPALDGEVGIDMTKGLGIDIPFMGGFDLPVDTPAKEMVADAPQNQKISSEYEEVRQFVEIFLRTPRQNPAFRTSYSPTAIFSMSASDTVLTAPGSPFPGHVRNFTQRGQPPEVWTGRDEIFRRFSALFGDIKFRPTIVSVPVSIGFGTTAVVVVGGIENFSFIRTLTIGRLQYDFAILSDQIHFNA
jgi:hypothetical protein